MPVKQSEKPLIKKEEVLKKLDDIKKVVKLIGHESVELYKKLEKEVIHGQKIVKIMLEISSLKKNRETLLKEIGTLTCKMNASELANTKIKDIVKKIKIIDSNVTKKEKSMKSGKSKK